MAKRTEKVEVYTDIFGRDTVEAVAKLYDCSMSTAGDLLIKREREQLFGDVDPGAIVDGRIPESDAHRLIGGELSGDDFDDDLRLDDTAEASPLPAASDGGAVQASQSNSPTLTPTDWAKAGQEQSWEDIKDAVKSSGQWSEDFEIHPSHVPRSPTDEDWKENRERYNYVRSSYKYATRVVAAMCRSVAGDSGIVPGAKVDDLIADHLSHVSQQGADYAVPRYKTGEGYSHNAPNAPSVSEILYADPRPGKDLYYTTREAFADALSNWIGSAVEIIDTPEKVPENWNNGIRDVETLLDYEAWKRNRQLNSAERASNLTKTQGLWYDDIAEWLQEVALLKHLDAECGEILEERGDLCVHPERYDTPRAYLRIVVAQALDAYSGVGYRETIESRLPKDYREVLHSES